MLIIYSKNIVQSDKITKGYLKIENGRIASIQDEIAQEDKTSAIDMSDYFVMPGFINLGSAMFDEKISCKSSRQDAQRAIRTVLYAYAINGVTKLYHTIRCTNYDTYKELERRLKFIKDYDRITPVESMIYLKFQIKTDSTMDAVRRLIDDGLVDFLSFDYMKNYKDSNMYKDYYTMAYLEDNLSLSSEMSEKVIEKLRQVRETVNIDEIAYIIKYAHYKGIKVSTPRYRSGMEIYKEFKDKPDILNVTDRESAFGDYDDMYKLVSSSAILENMEDESVYKLLDTDNLIVSTFTNPCDTLYLTEILEKKIGLPKTVSMFSKNPAAALQLKDYGEIKVGNIADISIFKKIDGKYCLSKMIKDGMVKMSIEI